MTTPSQPKPPSRGARSPGRAPAAPPPARTARELREATVAARRRARPETDTNPLRQGLRLERVPDPCAFVLFGATGDLAHRKVVPALYQLWRTNLLPSEFSLVAVARRPYTDKTFAAEVKASVEKYSSGSRTCNSTSATTTASIGWTTVSTNSTRSAAPPAIGCSISPPSRHR